MTIELAVEQLNYNAPHGAHGSHCVGYPNRYTHVPNCACSTTIGKLGTVPTAQPTPRQKLERKTKLEKIVSQRYLTDDTRS
jgi:hypothetical protein